MPVRATSPDGPQDRRRTKPPPLRRIAHVQEYPRRAILLGIIATFFTFQLLVGGMGFVALRQTNQDVGQLYRLSSEQVNAVNSAALSLVAARTDLTRYAARVAKGNPGDTTALRLARQRIAAGDRNFQGFASGLSAEEKPPRRI